MEKQKYIKQFEEFLNETNNVDQKNETKSPYLVCMGSKGLGSDLYDTLDEFAFGDDEPNTILATKRNLLKRFDPDGETWMMNDQGTPQTSYFIYDDGSVDLVVYPWCDPKEPDAFMISAIDKDDNPMDMDIEDWLKTPSNIIRSTDYPFYDNKRSAELDAKRNDAPGKSSGGKFPLSYFPNEIQSMITKFVKEQKK